MILEVQRLNTEILEAARFSKVGSVIPTFVLRYNIGNTKYSSKYIIEPFYFLSGQDCFYGVPKAILCSATASETKITSINIESKVGGRASFLFPFMTDRSPYARFMKRLISLDAVYEIFQITNNGSSSSSSLSYAY